MSQGAAVEGCGKVRATSCKGAGLLGFAAARVRRGGGGGSAVNQIDAPLLKNRSVRRRFAASWVMVADGC